MDPKSILRTLAMIQMSHIHAPHQGQENVLLAVGVDAGQPDGQHHDELREEL